MPVPL